LPVISGCPGRAQCCQCLSSTNSTLHSELLESDSESLLVSYSDSARARGSESLSLSESSESYYSRAESSYFLPRVLQLELSS
jgi:hypothetical protein